MQELINNVVKWAEERNLIPGDPEKQYLKFLEEVGETARAILHNNKDGIKDGIGDVIVTVIIYAKQIGREIDVNAFQSDFASTSQYAFQYAFMTMVGRVYAENFIDFAIRISELCNFFNLTPEECLQAAWDEIKDRKGKTINGTFIKDE